MLKGMEEAEPEKQTGVMTGQNGLSKTIFFKLLMQHGVLLNEHDKALVTTVFGMRNQNNDKLDYEKLDSAFEGVQ